MGLEFITVRCDVLVVILAGSLKDNQEKVIKEAKKNWEDYKNLFN
jgi:putative component of toxin-antitoxin plasmid stabilization module